MTDIINIDIYISQTVKYEKIISQQINNSMNINQEKTHILNIQRIIQYNTEL